MNALLIEHAITKDFLGQPTIPLDEWFELDGTWYLIGHADGHSYWRRLSINSSFTRRASHGSRPHA